MSVALVSDSCHYLPAPIREDCAIHQVSLYVHRNGEAIRELDIGDVGEYYHQLAAEPELPTTSQPSVGDFIAVYEPLLSAGHEIVSIHLSGGMSGTVRSAEQARDQLGAAAGRIHVIDSETACGGEGLMLMGAARAIADGADAAIAADRAREVRRHLKLWFAIDTLEYLRRGGRIAGAQAWLGTALKIKPILAAEREITPVERVRTSKKAVDRLLKLLQDQHAAGSDGWAIQHIQAPDEAAALADRARELFGTEPILVSEIGPVIGTHVGPGLLGAGAVPRALVQ